MALIYCPDCGKQISDSAPACPHCGRPMLGCVVPAISEKYKKQKVGAIALIVLGTIGCIGSVGTDNPNDGALVSSVFFCGGIVWLVVLRMLSRRSS